MLSWSKVLHRCLHPVSLCPGPFALIVELQYAFKDIVWSCHWCILLLCLACRFTLELEAADAAAATKAGQAQHALEQLRQELTAKLQAEKALLQQQTSASLSSAASLHDQALMTQHAQHAQAVQKMQAEASSLASSKQSLQTEMTCLKDASRQLQGQVQALQGSVLEQAQHAQQAVAQLRSEHESEMLSMEAVHAGRVVALKEQQAASAQEADEALQAQQQQAEHMQATLLARFAALERRFNARYVSSKYTFMKSSHIIHIACTPCD